MGDDELARTLLRRAVDDIEFASRDGADVLSVARRGRTSYRLKIAAAVTVAGLACGAVVASVLASPPERVQPAGAGRDTGGTPLERDGGQETDTMPDLLGLPAADAHLALGRLELASNWRAPVLVDCGVRPRTVARQDPAPGTPLTRNTSVVIRLAAIDVRQGAEPCSLSDGNLGPADGAAAELARDFYRFSADPTLGAPFASSPTWVGIESGPNATSVTASERADRTFWEIEAAYAENVARFSALDTLAGSGGYYEVHEGVVPTCKYGGDTGDAPAELAGLNAISIVSPQDTVASCLDWWNTVLYIDDDGEIRGVSLRLGGA